MDERDRLLGGGLRCAGSSRHYGAGPIHLVGLAACFAVAAYALAKVLGESGWKEILLWFAICVVAHDLIVWPVYGIADRIGPPGPGQIGGAGLPLVPWINHVRVPAVISALLLVMFFPLILRLSNSYYQQVTGFNENVYLINWLAVTGILFAGSALALRHPAGTCPQAGEAVPGPLPPGRHEAVDPLRRIDGGVHGHAEGSELRSVALHRPPLAGDVGRPSRCPRPAAARIPSSGGSPSPR